MKRICIDEKICKKKGITPLEFSYLLFLTAGVSVDKVTKDLMMRGLITPTYDRNQIVGYSVMDKGHAIIESVLIDSTKEPIPDERLEFLAREMRGMFPDGKKEGTALYWKGSTKEIATRLKSFFHKFGEYDDGEILDATKRYVDSFMSSGHLKNMRVLKYFIWKRIDVGNAFEESSDLLSFIENSDEVVGYSDDWTTKLK